VRGQLHTLEYLPSGQKSRSHWIGGRVGTRADLDNVEKRKFLTLPELELRPLGRPACSQSTKVFNKIYRQSIIIINGIVKSQHTCLSGERGNFYFEALFSYD
jgi:hypothetical protein